MNAHLENTRRTPRWTALLSAILILSLYSTPAWSDSWENVNRDARSPVAFDLLVLRPLGIIGVTIGSILFVMPVAPLTLISRPKEIGPVFNAMIVKPALYVISDPLGEH